MKTLCSTLVDAAPPEILAEYGKAVTAQWPPSAGRRGMGPDEPGRPWPIPDAPKRRWKPAGYRPARPRSMM